MSICPKDFVASFMRKIQGGGVEIRTSALASSHPLPDRTKFWPVMQSPEFRKDVSTILHAFGWIDEPENGIIFMTRVKCFKFSGPCELDDNWSFVGYYKK